jgi:eukaryotic-like serine/threonine-protein kinase
MGEAPPSADLSGRSLGSYRLLRPLGTGGMGEVYLAEDTRLGRRVALKVLPRETAAHPDKIQRFEREARAIAALNHPGIVTLHSIEEADGHRFLTMEHVEGQTLASSIPVGGLPLARLLPVAIALADAVAAAHQRGILHRDLKPENVMITPEERVKVLDFGLAKLRVDLPGSGDDTTRETQSVTQDGRIVGTVAYMSPEQAQGLPVDHRSDVFSLGVLLYEMASGERPFTGRTNLSVLSAILKDDPRPVQELRDDLPRPLARMIERALAKRPEDRYQSTADLRRDLEDLKRDHDTGELLRSGAARRRATRGGRGLRWALPVAASALVALVLGAGAAFYMGGRGGAAEGDGRSSIAVFYFDNLTGDTRLDWLRSGLTDMLVTNLSQSPALRVLSTSRLYQLLEEAGSLEATTTSARVVAAVARRAETGTALVGSFVRAGSKIRIQAQLQDPATGEVLASERVEGDAEEGLFTLVDELTRRIRNRLELKALAAGSESRIEAVTTSSVEAYRDFVQGMNHHERLEEHEARAFLERAVARDPGFAMAQAKLSVIHANLGDMPKAREYAARALERAERLPPAERYYIEGRYYSLDPTTFNKAIAAYQAAVDAVPDQTAARNNLAQLLIYSRRYGEALVHLEELRRRGFTFPGTWMSLAEAYVASGQPGKAEQALVEYVQQYPDRAAGYENLAQYLTARGRYDEALRAYDRVGQLDSRNFKVDLGRFTVESLRGRWTDAEQAARRLYRSPDSGERWHGGAALAVLALYRGDPDAALAVTDEGLRQADTPDQRARVRLFRAEIDADLGRPEEALAEVKQALAEHPEEAKVVAWAHTCRTTCLARAGKQDEAEKSRAEVETWLRSLPAPLAEPHRLQLEGELAWGRHDLARARELLTRASALLPDATIESKVPSARIHYALGRVALEQGATDLAREAFRRVVDAGVERLWEPVVYVRSLGLLGRLEDEAGHPEEARRLYGSYLSHWKGGAIDRADVARAQERLATLGGPPTRPPSPAVADRQAAD